MPECLLRLCSHVAAYKPVMKKWQSGDCSEFLSLSPYPEDLLGYVESSYSELKAKQAALRDRYELKAMSNSIGRNHLPLIAMQRDGSVARPH